MQSSTQKKWILKFDPSLTAIAEKIAREMNISPVTAKLLINRGCADSASAERFFNKTEELLRDPFMMKDMVKAAERIVRAIENDEKTVIYGDYDVDGVTSVSILTLYLKSVGMTDISYYIPSRTGEGYGISPAAVENLSRHNYSLVITVDTGVTAIEEAKLIHDAGMELVITDHHECLDDIPSAYAVVNPHRRDCDYPFKDLAGVGVVYKLLCAVESVRSGCSVADAVRKVSASYLDLVAMGTIADVMPVRDENRLIIAKGLEMMTDSPRPAISELIAAVDAERKSFSARKITSGYVGFTLAPRINAAGRIGSASTAVELFLSDDPEKTARIASELCEINKQRQNEENKIIEAAYEQIVRQHDFSRDRVIVLSDEKWHHGVIGIVASRITERYGCPSILISFEGGGEAGHLSGSDIGKGSGRSVKGMNLVKALSSCSDLLIRYGGHELAAGLTVARENLPELQKRLNEYARTCFDNEDIEIVTEAECELTPAEATMAQAEELYKFEPYGVSNPLPVFMMNSMKVTSVGQVGGGKHTKFQLSSGRFSVCAMYFRMTVSDLDIYEGDMVDVLFTLDINEFQNNRSVQFILKDMRLAEPQAAAEAAERELFDRVWNVMGGGSEMTDELYMESASVVPAREDFVSVYNVLRRELRMEHEVFSIRALLNLLTSLDIHIGYVKLKFIIYIFRELNLLGVDEIDFEREIYRYKYVYVKTKTELDKSGIYRKLKALFAKRSGR